MGARGLWVSFPCFPAVSGPSGTFQWILATSYLSLSFLNEVTVSRISKYAGGGDSDRGADSEPMSPPGPRGARGIFCAGCAGNFPVSPGLPLDSRGGAFPAGGEPWVIQLLGACFLSHMFRYAPLLEL